MQLRLRGLRIRNMLRLLSLEALFVITPDSSPNHTRMYSEFEPKPSIVNWLLTVRRPSLLPKACAGILLWPVLTVAAFAACTPPPRLKADLQDKPSAETYADLGAWFGNQKQFGCAADAYSSAAKLQPNSASYQYLWGLSLYSAGQTTEAEEPLQAAARLNPSDVRPLLALGAVLDHVKQTAAAEADWRAALAIDPDSETALDALSQDLIDDDDYEGVITLLGKSGEARVRSPLQSLNLGVAYANLARLNEASTALREGLNTTPDSLPLARELALVLKLLSRNSEAYAVLDLALQHHPGDLDTELLYCRMLVSGHSENAPPLLHKVLLAHPDNAEALYLSSVLETEDGDFTHAREHLERSVDLNPNDAKAQMALGNVLAKFQDLHGAKEHFEKAIALGVPDPEVHYDLAKVLQSLGEGEQAQEELRTYQQLNKAQADRTEAAGKALVGDEALAAGDAVKAAALYRAALASNPDEPYLSYKLSQALDKTNDLAGERAALQRAIELDPKLAEAQNQMGYLSARSGDAIAAEAYFHAAIQASPSYVSAWINLAATLASEAKWQDATAAVDHALAIDPSNAEARDLERAILAAQPKQ
jgi:tetratricopeptide (TPR) repeat protein